MQLKIRGTLIGIGKEVQVTDSFKKKEFLIKTNHEEYPQEVKFDLVQTKTNLLDTFAEGQEIVVSFNIRGSRSKKDNRVFNNLQAWRIEEFTPSIPQQAPPQALQEPASAIAQEVPQQSPDFADIPF